MQDKNPVDATRFFRDYCATEAFHIPKNKVSYILPTQFQERIVRVYSRSVDVDIVTAIHVSPRKRWDAFVRVIHACC